MPAVVIYGLPDCMTEEQLKCLRDDLKSSLNSIGELAPSSSKFIFYFPMDHFMVKLGQEVVIFVDGTVGVAAILQDVKNRLAKALGEAVQRTVPEAISIECYVMLRGANPDTGFWSSQGDSAVRETALL